MKPTAPAHGVVGHLNPDSRRFFKPLQHGEGGEGVFQAADLVDELFQVGGLLIVHFAAFFQQQLTQGGKFTVLMAGALVSILPLVIVFFMAQKLFIEGIALSGVKR